MCAAAGRAEADEPQRRDEEKNPNWKIAATPAHAAPAAAARLHPVLESNIALTGIAASVRARIPGTWIRGWWP